MLPSPPHLHARARRTWQAAARGGAEPPARAPPHARARTTPRANSEPPPTSPPRSLLLLPRAVADRSALGLGVSKTKPERVRALLASAMVASSSSAASSSSSSSSSSPVPSGAHRRRLADVERDAAADCCSVPSDDDDSDGGTERRGNANAKALLFVARRSGGGGKRSVPVADRAWVRSAVACLLGATVLVLLVLVVTSSRRGDDVGAGRLVRKVDAGDGELLGWREENLAAVARRPPDPPVSASSITPLTAQLLFFPYT